MLMPQIEVDVISLNFLLYFAHSKITKGERMIKLFFLVKHKTRWKEPGFIKGT